MDKDQKTDIDGMIMGAHYLHALDKECQACQPLSEMEREGYLAKINSLTTVILNHREAIRMRMDKFTCCANSRSNWLKTGARSLKPLCEYFKEKLLKVKSILHIDETWCRIRIKYKGGGTKLGKY